MCFLGDFNQRTDTLSDRVKTTDTIVRAIIICFVTEHCFVTYIMCCFFVIFIQFDHADYESGECQTATVEHFEVSGGGYSADRTPQPFI